MTDFHSPPGRGASWDAASPAHPLISKLCSDKPRTGCIGFGRGVAETKAWISRKCWFLGGAPSPSPSP